MKTKTCLSFLMTLFSLLILMASCKITKDETVDVKDYAFNDADRMEILVSVGVKNNVNYLQAYSFRYKDITDDGSVEVREAKDVRIDSPIFENGKINISLNHDELNKLNPSYLEFSLAENGAMTAHYVVNILKGDLGIRGNCEMMKK